MRKKFYKILDNQTITKDFLHVVNLRTDLKSIEWISAGEKQVNKCKSEKTNDDKLTTGLNCYIIFMDQFWFTMPFRDVAAYNI